MTVVDHRSDGTLLASASVVLGHVGVATAGGASGDFAVVHSASIIVSLCSPFEEEWCMSVWVASLSLTVFSIRVVRSSIVSSDVLP